jgi:hypothetical protein
VLATGIIGATVMPPVSTCGADPKRIVGNDSERRHIGFESRRGDLDRGRRQPFDDDRRGGAPPAGWPGSTRSKAHTMDSALVAECRAIFGVALLLQASPHPRSARWQAGGGAGFIRRRIPIFAGERSPWRGPDRARDRPNRRAGCSRVVLSFILRAGAAGDRQPSRRDG